MQSEEGSPPNTEVNYTDFIVTAELKKSHEGALVFDKRVVE